jgi:hypothetical protein
MPWRLVSRKQQKDSKLGSREVRGPLNKRGSCRTFFFSDDSCRTLGVLEKNDVRPSVSRSVLLTSILVILYLETGPSIGVIVSPFFFTANICTIQMCTHDTYTRNTIILLLCVSAQGLFSSQKILQNFSDSPSHRIFEYMHEALNIDKKNKTNYTVQTKWTRRIFMSN